METALGRALGDLAELASEKWYALMGLLGFVVLAWVLVAGTLHDDTLIALIAGSFAALGCAESETRTTHERLVRSYGDIWKISKPVRYLTPIGAVLYAIGALLALLGVLRAVFAG